MSTENLTPQQRTAATKKRRTNLWIADAARTLFNQHGWHGVTRDQVAEEAGVGFTTLSKHFPTKRSLAIAAYAPQVIVFMSTAGTALATKAEAEPLLVKFIQELADYLAAHPAMAIALLPLSRDPRSHGEDEEATHVVSFRDLVEFISKLLVQCSNAHGQDSAAVDDTADFALSGLLTWIVQHPERSGKDAAVLMLRHLL
ncbi:MAG TPA: helix-turn-helix domain-containing protein [Actinocrinis sp.]|nr:helix-turn-helix domain-containing protein [Actinocrinis sp.]